MPKKIIAIIDTVANDIAGPLHIMQHDAVAIRFFGDVASHPESQIGKHIDDYQLVQLGILDDDMSIITDKRIILTGTTWAAAQNPNQTNLELGA